MKGKKGEKSIEVQENCYNNMGGKKYYMRNRYLSMYLNCNNVGNVFLSDEESKWGHESTDLTGAYLLKHQSTGLYLTTNENDELFVTENLHSTYQKWFVHLTSEPEIYAYKNACNSKFISTNLKGDLFLTKKPADGKDGKIIKEEENFYLKGLFYSFQNFPKK